MSRITKSRYDDYDEYDDYEDEYDRIIKKKNGNNLLLWGLIGGGIALLLLICLLGVGFFVMMSRLNGTQPDEFVGSWKSKWTIGGVTFDSVYTFNKDGTFREKSFDLQRRPRNITDGHWRFRNGQIEINWLNGGFEHATATHVDARTINYRVVNHTDRQQIGMTVTLRRQ